MSIVLDFSLIVLTDILLPARFAEIKNSIKFKMQPATSNVLELDHSSGFNGKIVNSVILHPDQQHYVQIAGAALIIGDLKDTHNQEFLRGHDDQITCAAVGNLGTMIASGM